MPRRTPYKPPPIEQEGLRTLLATLLAGSDDLQLASALDTLAVDNAIVRLLSARRAELVDRARAAGASWSDVGTALNLNRSDAFNRYAHPTD